MTTLRVPGAQLHYTTQGHGPLLLLIPGANGDGAIFQPVARELAARFTVVTYDRRGFSSSPLDAGQVPEHRLLTDADDARRLIEHLGAPATVFGSSSGAIVALHVLLHHAPVVRTLLAHEPPALALLPDADRWRSTMEGVYTTYRQEGVPQAMRAFMNAVMGPDTSVDLHRAQAARSGEHVLRNTQYWLEHEVRQYSGAAIDTEGLRALRERLVLVYGRESHGQTVTYQPLTRLAELLGLTPCEVPGAHLGYATHPAEFAQALLAVLSARDAQTTPGPR